MDPIQFIVVLIGLVFAGILLYGAWRFNFDDPWESNRLEPPQQKPLGAERRPAPAE